MALKAKKKVAKVVEPKLNEEEIATMEVEVELPKKKMVMVEPKKPEWEIKDRFYYLANGSSPVSLAVKSTNIFWFDEDKGYEREVMYTRNQKTVFVDEMVGVRQIAHITFRNGALMVPRNQQTLQKLLSLYHPHKGRVFLERDEVAVATSQIDTIELELEAMNAAVSLDIDMAEAVMRAEVGSRVSEMSSKELKRDLLIFAKGNPGLFLELLDDDNIHLRNIGIKATEAGILKLSPDNRAFFWATNNRKLITIPFDEHPYSALASWFKTDEGMEVLNSIEKRLN